MKEKLEEKEDHYVPYQSIFILLSMDPIPSEQLRIWVERAKEFYNEYKRSERVVIDFAMQVIEKENRIRS
jgi:hypothetical protein